LNPQAILASVAVLGGVGFTFGTLIAIANRKLYVWEDPRIDELTDILPGANCGACGFAGCRAFAEAAIDGEVAPVGCTVMGEAELEDVAEMLGVAAGEADKVVARLLSRAARRRSRSVAAERPVRGAASVWRTAPWSARSTRSG